MVTDYLQTVDWSRAQFALTAIYHWLFVPLTLGLSVLCALMETAYYRTKDPFWRRTTKFWMRLFGVNFAIGVATGLILEFEFGTNWSNYSNFVGDIFGAPLAIEGIMAFFLESTFVAVMFFGWDKVSRGFHLSATWLTAIGANLSAWWILVANAWMQHPVGCDFNLLRNKHDLYRLYAGARLAYTSFHYDVTTSAPVPDPVWGGTASYSATDVEAKACWAEVCGGIDVTIWRFVHMGWMVRYRARLSQSHGTVGEPYYIPGFGRNGSSRIGATFNLSFEL